MPDFDPYHKWLGIPPTEQPPDHYRLLGVRPLESDPDVIANAADQRMTHLRTLQTGKHGILTQKLLNELSVARNCLLNPAKKAAYDRTLQAPTLAPPPLATPLGAASRMTPHAITPPAMNPPVIPPPLSPGVAAPSIFAADMAAPVLPKPAGQVPFGAPSLTATVPRALPMGTVVGAESEPLDPALVEEINIYESQPLGSHAAHYQEPLSLDAARWVPWVAAIVGALVIVGLIIVYYHGHDATRASSGPIVERVRQDSGEESPSSAEERPAEQQAKGNAKPGVSLPNGAPTKAVGGASSDENNLKQLLEYVRSKVSADKTHRTTGAGGPGGDKFVTRPDEGALLVGFDVATGAYQKKIVVKSIKPLFLIRPEDATAEAGSFSADFVTVRAKPGYAVGGIELRTGARVEAVRVIFMRIASNSLDTRDTYTSDWVGASGNKPAKIIGNNGLPVVGVFGSAKATLFRLGLIQVD